MPKKIYLLEYEFTLFDNGVGISYENQGLFKDFLLDLKQSLIKEYSNRLCFYGLSDLMKQITFKIEESEFSLNAYAEYTSKQNFIIGVNFGTFLALSDIFHLACSTEDFFEDYGFNGLGGYSIKESTNSKRFVDYSHLANFDDKDFIGNCFLNFPTEDERLYLAKILTIYSYRFVLGHEFGHISRGHLHYLSSLKEDDKTRIFELNDSSNFESHNSERIVLEHQADQSSISNTFDVFEAVEVIKVLPPYKFRNHLDWARIYLVSVGTTCLLFEKAHNREFDNNNYPSPACRLLNVLVRFSQTYNYDGYTYSQIFRKALEDKLQPYFDNYTLADNLIELELIINNALVDLETISGLLKIDTKINFDYILNDVFNKNLFNFSDSDEAINTLSPYGKELRKLLKYDSEVMIDRLEPFVQKIFPGKPSRMYCADYNDEKSNEIIREENERVAKIVGDKNYFR